MVTSNHEIIQLLLNNCHLAVMNCNVKYLICRISDMQPVKGAFRAQIEKHWYSREGTDVRNEQTTGSN